jgi:hypothetical protein
LGLAQESIEKIVNKVKKEKLPFREALLGFLKKKAQ